MKKLGIYIHIPFCRRKCHYCDFVSYPGMDDMFDKYIDALIAEARLYEDYISEHSVDTVFIGGGTPSLLSLSQIERLVRGIRSVCDRAPDEFTIETNPETLDASKLEAYANNGINRLSLGLQTHNNSVLRCIGRHHTFEVFQKSYNAAKKHFSNINIDIMFSLPGQNVENFKTTVKRVVDIAPEHVSAYALKLEPGTKMAQEFSETDEQKDRQMYHSVVNLLENAGYAHYETSNFALSGSECIHNLKYWMGDEYLGLGVAAHSYIYNEKKIRFCNTNKIEEYMRFVDAQKKPAVKKSILNSEDQEVEYIMLRLRLKHGIDFDDYHKIFGQDFVKKFEEPIALAKKSGLITRDLCHIRPTLKGFDLQNTLISEFMKKI